jgi:hypothetical protein
MRTRAALMMVVRAARACRRSVVGVAEACGSPGPSAHAGDALVKAWRLETEATDVANADGPFGVRLRPEQR